MRRNKATQRTGSSAPAPPPRWVGLFFFAAALAVPLLYSNATIDPVLLPRFLLVSILGIVLVGGFGLSVLRGSSVLTFHRSERNVLGVLVAFIVVAAISVLVTGATPDGIFELLKMTLFAVLLYATSRAIDGDPARLALLCKLVVVATFLVGGFAVLQYFQVALFEWMQRDVTVDSTMAHRNLLASFLVLAFPFSAYLFLEGTNRWRVASTATIAISMFLIVALQTRSAWIAFPGGLACSLVALAVVARSRDALTPKRASGRRVIQAAAVLTVAGALALFVDAPGSRAPMREHVGSLVQMRHASIQERFQLWNRTIRMIREHPQIGVGLGNWRVVVPRYGSDALRSDTGTLHFQRPHNDFLWMGSETGLIGGLLYIAFFVTAFGLGLSGLRRTRAPRDRVVLALMIWGVSSFVLASLFSFPKERVAHLVYLALLIGTMLSFARKSASAPVVWSLSKRTSLVVILLVWGTTLFAGRIALARTSAEVHLRRALQARARGDWSQMVEHLDRIDTRFYVMDPTSAPVMWYRGVARFEMGQRDTALGDFRAALAVHPNHVHVLNNIATCQTLRGEHDEAVRLYESALEIAPRFEDARINLAFVLHDLGRNQEAYDLLAPHATEISSPRFHECFQRVKAALGLSG